MLCRLASLSADAVDFSSSGHRFAYYLGSARFGVEPWAYGSHIDRLRGAEPGDGQ
jgi:hypothetical protein